MTREARRAVIRDEKRRKAQRSKVMDHAKIGDVTVSRLLLGSNPFSGFSHQGRERDRAETVVR